MLCGKDISNSFSVGKRNKKNRFSGRYGSLTSYDFRHFYFTFSEILMYPAKIWYTYKVSKIYTLTKVLNLSKHFLDTCEQWDDFSKWILLVTEICLNGYTIFLITRRYKISIWILICIYTHSLSTNYKNLNQLKKLEIWKFVCLNWEK